MPIENRARYIRETMREVADDQSTAVAYLSEGPNGSRPAALMFSGKRGKPDSNFYYGSPAARDKAVTDHRDGVRRREAYKADQAAKRKAARVSPLQMDFATHSYLSVAECAALLRHALKEAFPGQKFSVRSEGSLNVRWTDGPALKTVEAIASRFSGSYFDGMEDYKGSIYHSIDGHRVSFGCDFVFCTRDLSRAALEAGEKRMRAARAHAPAVTITGKEPYWQVETDSDLRTHYHEKALPMPGNEGLNGAEHALAAWFDDGQRIEAQPSKTMARIKVLGTDGYGHGGEGAAPGHENSSAALARMQMQERAREEAEELEQAPPPPVRLAYTVAGSATVH